MGRILKYSAIGLVVALTACYHATIDTGLPPSAEVIDKPWASGWIFGLVPPKPLETMSNCPNGVAQVDTQLSFVNQLVSFLTLGIYTPMAIKVTCAASGRGAIPPGASQIYLEANPAPQEMQDALTRAAVLAFTSGKPVFIRP